LDGVEIPLSGISPLIHIGSQSDYIHALEVGLIARAFCNICNSTEAMLLHMHPFAQTSGMKWGYMMAVLFFSKNLVDSISVRLISLNELNLLGRGSGYCHLQNLFDDLIPKKLGEVFSYTCNGSPGEMTTHV